MARHVRDRTALHRGSRRDRRTHDRAREVPEEVLRVGSLRGLGSKDPARRRNHRGDGFKPAGDRRHRPRRSVLQERSRGISHYRIPCESAGGRHAEADYLTKIGFYWVLLGSTRFYKVSMGSTGSTGFERTNLADPSRALQNLVEPISTP